MVTFAIYPVHPIPGEGDCVPGTVKMLQIWLPESPGLRDLAECMCIELKVRMGGHVQVWDIE